MNYIFIHADIINGNALVAEGDILLIEENECKDMEDVRHYLSNMSFDDTASKPFERLLKVPEDLLDTIDQEYGVDI